MKSLIVGHSQAKYFDKYLCLPDTKCLSFSGCSIEDLIPLPGVKQKWDTSEVKRTIPDSEIVAVLVGINNIPQDSPDLVVEKFNALISDILSLNPGVKILVSTILPRVSNLRPTGTHYSIEELDETNEDIDAINDSLKRGAQHHDAIYVVEHPQFTDSAGHIQDSLLAEDGLHLSFEGTRVVVENIESAIIEVHRAHASTKCRPIGDHNQSAVSDHNQSVVSEVYCRSEPVTNEEEKLSYANVVKFCDAREQPVIPRKTTNVCHPKKTQKLSKSVQRQKPLKRKPAVKRNSKANVDTSDRAVEVPRKVEKVTSFLSNTFNEEFYFNRFSVLTTEDDSDSGDDCDSEDCESDVVVEIPSNKRLYGGGKREKQQKPKIEQPSVETVDVVLPQSIELELPVSANDNSEVTVNVEEAGISDIQCDLQDLETTTRDMSFDCEHAQLRVEIIEADTDISKNELSNVNENKEHNKIETQTNETPALYDSPHIADTSVDEVIDLLNCKENKGTISQDNSCPVVTGNKTPEIVNISEGQMFENFHDFDQSKMRAHLISCFLDQKFSNFPFNINTNWKKKKQISLKENIFCICRGLYDSEMIFRMVSF